MSISLLSSFILVVFDSAEVDTGGGRVRSACIASPEGVRKGDYVLLYANLITEKIDRRSALETFRYLGEMAAAASGEDGMDASRAKGTYERQARRLAGPPGLKAG